jgi:hypothetical protein
VNTIITVKGLNWPRRLDLPFRSDLLGPWNNLGRFRWYYECHLYLGESYSLTCYKVDSFLKVVALGKLRHSCASPADFLSQKSRLIAKCIREARPI